MFENAFCKAQLKTTQNIDLEVLRHFYKGDNMWLPI